jgi:hypothetical protein
VNRDQQILASLIAKRNAAAADYERYRHAAKSLTQSEQVADKATEEAAAQLEAAMVAKIKGDGDGDTSAARAAYQTALAALAVAEAEARAGKIVVADAEATLETLTKQAAHQAVEVCKAIAKHDEVTLREAAEAFGKQLARRRAITRAARAASATTGLNSDPVAELNLNNPLKLKLDELIDGKELDAIFYAEQDLLNAKLGGANGG